jgi:hypothetical protein
VKTEEEEAETDKTHMADEKRHQDKNHQLNNNVQRKVLREATLEGLQKAKLLHQNDLSLPEENNQEPILFQELYLNVATRNAHQRKIQRKEEV